MSVLARPATGDGGNRLLVKGAPEMLLARCTKIMLPSGEVIPMSPDFRETLRAKIGEMAVRPLRCLGLAVKESAVLERQLANFKEGDDPASVPSLSDIQNFAAIESDLTFVGLAGIKDPARPEVAPAMAQCQAAGIRVMVITGDAKDTAIAIARDVGIFGRDEDVTGRAWVGKEFFALDRQRQLHLLSRGNMLFCRAEPADKQRLVKTLQELNEVPAMTGDGVNDAPALQQAAIGVAMGITGTEVAKDAADMVLVDDNFATIVSAVEEGRAIYNNMQAFICFLISCNIGEIACIFFATLLGIPEPLTPLHLLWVNLVTDGPPATALGFNPPDPDAMSKPPRPRDEPIMSNWLLTRYLVTGMYVGTATISIFVNWYLQQGVTWDQLVHWKDCLNWSEFVPGGLSGVVSGVGDGLAPCDIFAAGRGKPQSLALTLLVFMEMLKALSAVSVDNSLLRVPPWRNPWLILGVLVPSLLHLAVLYTPAAADAFGLSPLSWEDWRYVAQFGLPIVLLEESLKAVGRRVNARKEAEQREALARRD
eukprot:TRINITY_DN50_c2_g1_i1.p1 TRINITY_DN50_c2_g1~~TRINITY_DN50_c2_g1_i1.p1  ORF type:complete len:537 (-),score=175.61 TRINITY_DN50_c2_g1_i1:332-1942(-)